MGREVDELPDFCGHCCNVVFILGHCCLTRYRKDGRLFQLRKFQQVDVIIPAGARSKYKLTLKLKDKAGDILYCS